MSPPSTLNWRELPLTGTSLIEASAGTGKTYNIALLYLRLVLERELDVRQILVTTFTEAAAQELRARIRRRLLDAESALESAAGDSDLGRFLDELSRIKGRKSLLTRVRLALADIDLAPISTIHGFCRRVLTDFPFDTGVSFTLGEVVDEPTLVRECVQDFWRQRFLGASVDLWDAGMILPRGIDDFAKIVGDILPMDVDAIAIEPTRDLRDWWAKFCLADHGSFLASLDQDKAFDQRNKGFRAVLRQLLAAASAGDPGAVDWDDLHTRLEPGAVERAGIKSFSPPVSTWPDIVALVEARGLFERVPLRVVNAGAVECAEFVRTQMRRRLQLRGQITFQQLIDEVHDRLTSTDAQNLAARLQQAWPVALIDEFQDTDARQWAIFDRVWQAEGPRDRALILIGDPKQSIYAFRGGDVHSYLRVRDSLPSSRVHSISRNFRSHPNLLNALNGLYAAAGEEAFADGDIEYLAVAAGEPEKWASFSSPQPLRLRFLPSPGDTKPERDKAAITSCADDIAQLLNATDSDYAPGDIAVLVDTNRRIGELRAELIARGVPVVGAGRANVLDSEWAEDVQLLLYALLHPADEYAVRGALATRLLGRTVLDLQRMALDPLEWETQLTAMLDLRALMDTRGPLAAIESVIDTQAPRLLASANGERVLTDLRHLGELLQAAAAECYGPEALYAWFVSARGGEAAGNEAGRERQLRIESETARVQLLTIHASKGLEYPVVFVPMAWRDKRKFSQGRARYHDEAHRLRLDLGSTKLAENESKALHEDLQERMRHLYVALTRAQKLCVVYAFDQSPTPRGADGANLRGALDVLLCAALNSPGDGRKNLELGVRTLQIDSELTEYSIYRRADVAPVERAARTPMPLARSFYGLYSFSSLTRMRQDSVTEFNRGAEDELGAVEIGYPTISEHTPSHPALAALAGAKGPGFGSAVHELLESAFEPGAAPSSGAAGSSLSIDNIRHALDRHSVRLAEVDPDGQLAAVAKMLYRTLSTEIDTGLRLGALPATARRAEFEFAFGLEAAQWSQLHHLLHAHQLGHWWPGSRPDQVLRGLMQGSLDLVFEWKGQFHVLDYKANWLGDRLSDYAAASLDGAMQEHYYGLQALIYTVALHRYLASRIRDYRPATHLGDSWYLFVRAVGLAPDAGIWRRRFPQSLIDGLDAIFSGREHIECA